MRNDSENEELKINPELILRRYLNEEIPREVAIEEIGLELIRKAEQEYQAIKEDIKWALNDSN